MGDDVQQKIIEAKEAGRFEGQVLKSLDAIDRTQREMNDKLTRQEGELKNKVDRSELNDIETKVAKLIVEKVEKTDFSEMQKEIKDLQRWRWILVGGFAAAQILIALAK